MYVDTSVRPQGEQVDAVAPAKLKLSQAIRIGARLSPPGDKHSWRDSCGGTCAVMAACEALFGKGFCAGDPAQVLRDHFDIGLGKWHSKLQLSVRYSSGHSRESIADWLQSIGL